MLIGKQVGIPRMGWYFCVEGLPILPGFSQAAAITGPSEEVATGTGTLISTPCVLSILSRLQEARVEVEHLVWSQESHRLIKNMDQEVNMI